MLAFIFGVVFFGVLAVSLLVLGCFWSVFKLIVRIFWGIVIGMMVFYLLVKLVMVSLYVAAVILGIVGVVALCRRKSG